MQKNANPRQENRVYEPSPHVHFKADVERLETCYGLKFKADSREVNEKEIISSLEAP